MRHIADRAVYGAVDLVGGPRLAIGPVKPAIGRDQRFPPGTPRSLSEREAPALPDRYIERDVQEPVDDDDEDDAARLEDDGSCHQPPDDRAPGLVNGLAEVPSRVRKHGDEEGVVAEDQGARRAPDTGRRLPVPNLIEAEEQVAPEDELDDDEEEEVAELVDGEVEVRVERPPVQRVLCAHLLLSGGREEMRAEYPLY